MQMFLLKMSQMLMGGTRFLGDADVSGAAGSFKDVVMTIANFINAMLTPILILVVSAGTVYAVVLGVNFARAETSDKREEAKKRLINAIIGIVIIFVLLLLLKILASNMDGILGYVAPNTGDFKYFICRKACI